ncbi:hypothetical protein GW17_00023097 [Ensete ventricosum]|nr:hypothetical protein GW17_00023097 [Ensete ventricosum]
MNEVAQAPPQRAQALLALVHRHHDPPLPRTRDVRHGRSTGSQAAGSYSDVPGSSMVWITRSVGKESDASTVEEEERKMSGGKMETRTLLDEIRDMDNGWLFDFGHPLINRVAECFFKAAGIGAVQAVTREAYFTAVEGQHRRLSYVCMQVHRRFGVFAGSGVDTGGVAANATGGKRSRFSDLRGAALALTADDTSHEQIVQCAITGAALSTAANLLSGIF